MPRQFTIREPIFVIGPSIAYIPLTRGLFSLVETESVDKMPAWNWQALWSRTIKSYYASHVGPRIKGKRKQYLMHNVLCPEYKGEVDHRNRNTLDNRKHANLRDATHEQNMGNRKCPSDNKLGIKGVQFRRGSYRARIRIDGRTIELGLFKLLEDARDAYRDAAIKFYGEFANF